MHSTAISQSSRRFEPFGAAFLPMHIRRCGILASGLGKWKRRSAETFPPSPMEPPEDLFPQRELQACLRLFWGNLSPLEQTVFLCRYRYLDTTAEIADRLGLSQRRVKGILRRMGKALRTSLKAAAPV